MILPFFFFKGNGEREPCVEDMAEQRFARNGCGLCEYRGKEHLSKKEESEKTLK